MFGFLKKKEIDNNNIKAFDGALKAINIFIILSEWEKAKKALDEIEYKEKDSLNLILDELEKLDDKEGVNKKEKIKLTDNFKKKQKRLNKLALILERKEEKYNKKVENERFKIRFKKIKEEVKILTGNKKNDQALGLLQKFIEENAENSSVIKFYNKEKKIILKNIEKLHNENENKVKDNAKLEAMILIGETVNLDKDKDKDKEENQTFFQKLKQRINFYKNIKERIKKKKLLDEINLLIEEDSKVKNDIAARKLANIHKGLVKELSSNKMLGYELYGKILGADKISGDTLGFVENDDKYNFFLGDATGHGIRAGFIITLLSRLFNKYVKSKSLVELTYEINNGLKQDLKSRNFITGIFFEILKDEIGKLRFVGMGHEPILIYRKNKKEIEKLIPGGLAAGIRLINKSSDIKVKNIVIENGDILLTYSDGIVENKNSEGNLYGIDRLIHAFQTIATSNNNIRDIYDYIINDVKIFRGGAQFEDDATILIVKREFKKDIVDESSDYLKNLKVKEGLNNSDIKKLRGKTIEDIDKELEVLKKRKETLRIIKILETLYYTGEILKLKQESIRFIKEGFIDKKINFYLKKAINNEKAYKIEQKNQKIVNKYSILEELLKKGDYETVITEAEEIISKDGNI
ncbi:MAG: PP2C family protein-serine/threonine phosphatase [Candidatus Gracilibacteria bacterium]